MEKMLPNMGQHGGPGGRPVTRPWRESQATNSTTNTATRIVLNSMVVWALYFGSLYRHPHTAPLSNKPVTADIVKKLKWSHVVCRDYLTVSLHSPKGRHLPAIGAVQGDCQWHLKNGGRSKRLRESILHRDSGNPNIYLNNQWQKGSIGGHVSYPNYSPTATRLCLCSRSTWYQVR